MNEYIISTFYYTLAAFKVEKHGHYYLPVKKIREYPLPYEIWSIDAKEKFVKENGFYKVKLGNTKIPILFDDDDFDESFPEYEDMKSYYNDVIYKFECKTDKDAKLLCDLHYL